MPLPVEVDTSLESYRSMLSMGHGMPMEPLNMLYAQAVKDAKGGAVEFRVEKAGIVHAGVGKASFSSDDLETNINAFVSAIVKAKPSGAKGTYVKKISLSSTMGPGVLIDASQAIAATQ